MTKEFLGGTSVMTEKSCSVTFYNIELRFKYSLKEYYCAIIDRVNEWMNEIIIIIKTVVGAVGVWDYTQFFFFSRTKLKALSSGT